MNTKARVTYYLHGKTGNSGWKIKWFTPVPHGMLQKIWAVI